MHSTPIHVTHTFAPVYNKQSKILILGTFPSVKSREGDFYYHHPQNRFWKVLSRLFETDLPLTIPAKKQMLLDHHTAIWDVIKSCDIIGSSDASIRNMQPNNISKILDNSSVKRLYANGTKAYELYMRYCYPKSKLEIVKLPSTSPANATYSLDRLVEVWKAQIEL